jgi:alanyl aminopeptidase
VCNLLTEVVQTFPLPGSGCPAWIHPNADGSGYYRWTLSPSLTARLLGPAWGRLTRAERLSSANTLVSASRDGKVPAAEIMARLPVLTRTVDPPVNEQVLKLFGEARRYWVSPADEARLATFMRATLRPLLAKVGWTERAGESWRVQSFRAKLIGFLALEADDRESLDRAARLGRAWLGADGPADPDSVTASLRQPALRAAARRGDARLFDLIERRLRTENDPGVRYDLASALASFLQPALAARTRELLLSPDLHLGERDAILRGNVAEPELRVANWEFVVRRQKELLERLPGIAQQFLPWFQKGCSEAEAKELESGIAPSASSVPSIPFQLRKALESTRVCAAVREVQTPSVAAFLARAGRAPRPSAPR